MALPSCPEAGETDQLNQVPGIVGSDVVLRATGAKAVAEPAAILSAGNGPLLVQKMKFPNVTVALAEICQPFSLLSLSNG
ncbi:MAG: hypothetical protein D3909_09590 [Candidatus Electrothrix sp. ATG1]|nr:hypothetical protein [Candidatus Electrothrix sp. ATG1]